MGKEVGAYVGSCVGQGNDYVGQKNVRTEERLTSHASLTSSSKLHILSIVYLFYYCLPLLSHLHPEIPWVGIASHYTKDFFLSGVKCILLQLL